MDVQERVQDEAVQNILFMTFCVFVFSFGAIIFNTDIYALIVEPLDAISGQMRKLGERIKSLAKKPDDDSTQAEHLQKAIFKMGGLLTMVFSYSQEYHGQVNSRK
jgi:hypothetical protein